MYEVGSREPGETGARDWVLVAVLGGSPLGSSHAISWAYASKGT